MSPRPSSERLRREIVEATLALLATTPIDGVTTREVARRVGVSQRALLRHFRSRDEILEAAVAHTREQLDDLAQDVLGRGAPPLQALEVLLRGVVGLARSNPGVPRLLLHDAANASGTRYHQPIRQLVAMQRMLVKELVRRAQGSGELSGSIDAERAGDLFVALIQGVLLQWQLSGRDSDLEGQANALLPLWRAGLEAGEPCAHREPRSEATEEPTDPASSALFVLDLRTTLGERFDPLDQILRRLEHLPVDGVLKVIAPFRPGPLLSLLGFRGYRASARELAPQVWDVEIQPPGAVEIADYRDLEAPLPLQRILEATPGLEAGGALLARVPRVPRLLFPHLEQRNLTWEVYRELDGSALIRVCKPA